MSITKKQTIFDELIENEVLHIGRAVDIGCGNGRDAMEFIKKGFIVDAIDSDSESTREIPLTENLNIINTKIEDFDLKIDTYDLVSCQFVLHFLSKQDAQKIISKMIDSAKLNGIITFTLLGSRDDWKDKWSTWEVDEISDFMNKFPVKIYKSVIEEGFGKTRKGTIKYWHIYNLVYRKVA